MHTFPNLIQYVTIKQIYKDCLNFTYLDKLSWLLRKSGLVKKVTGLNIFQGDQPWAGQLQNTLPCLAISLLGRQQGPVRDGETQQYTIPVPQYIFYSS